MITTTRVLAVLRNAKAAIMVRQIMVRKINAFNAARENKQINLLQIVVLKHVDYIID